MGFLRFPNFSDRTFSEFFEEHTGIDIDHARYKCEARRRPTVFALSGLTRRITLSRR